MLIIQYCAIAAAAICLCALLSFLLHVIRAGNPKDMSEKSGDTGKGILYANTEAMLPQNKESAYLHIPPTQAACCFTSALSVLSYCSSCHSSHPLTAG